MNANDHRFGHAVLLGRPNVGKSTLLNRLVGEPLAIVTHKAQTTRHRIRGIVHDERGQVVFVDTPGLHRRRDHALNRRLNRTAGAALAGIEVIVVVIDAGAVTDEDRQVLSRAFSAGVPVVLAINKIDTLKQRDRLLALTAELSAEGEFAAVRYVSASTGDGVADLLASVIDLLPPGLPAYADDIYTDRSVRFLAAEKIREQLMLMLHEELPYGLSVVIERFAETPRRTEIDALILVAEERHKGMVIGRGGQVLKRVGTRARQAIARMLDRPVHLALHVKARPGWFDDERSLDELGYGD